MVRKNFVLRALLVMALLFVGILFAAQRPADNIDAQKRPGLAEAQKLTNRAYD